MRRRKINMIKKSYEKSKPGVNGMQRDAEINLDSDSFGIESMPSFRKLK